MKLIDADALKKEAYSSDEWDRRTQQFDLPVVDIYTIDEAPTIDIVRCEECKYWDDRRNDAWWSEEGACYLTSRLGYATYRNHDDFCSRGERKDDE